MERRTSTKQFDKLKMDIRRASLLQEVPKKKLKPKTRFKAAVRKVIANADWLVDVDDEEIAESGNFAKLNLIMIKSKKKNAKSLLSLCDKSILMKEASERTDDERRRICFIIGGLKCFRRYPEEVRRQLAASTYFVYYHAEREVVRQGHDASALYFILEGTVRVSISLKDPITGKMMSKEVGVMESGDMFGEVSLLHNIPRTATITTAANCNLLCLRKEDFETILKASLQEQWDECKAAMKTFPYFDGWNEVAVRECCILSKMRSYSASETILGDGAGQPAFVYFVLSGEVRIIEALTLVVKRNKGLTTYTRYNEKMKLSLFDEMKLETYFMQVCQMKKGACFSIGEFLCGRTVEAITPVQCLLCPRYWIMQNNKANIWPRIQLFLNHTIPSSQQLYEDFLEQRKWLQYRKQLVGDVLKKHHTKNSTTIHDVPYSLRIRENMEFDKPGFPQTRATMKKNTDYLDNAILMEANKTSMY